MKFNKEKLDFKKNNHFIFLAKYNDLFSLKVKVKIDIDDLLGIDEQKKILINNTDFFLKNKKSNNILLWGERGMGKSTLIKCVVKYFNDLKKNLYIVEILNKDIESLPEIIYFLNKVDKKFLIFIDDLSIDSTDNKFKLFKSMIEGSFLSESENIKFYITSNLRHISHRNIEKSDDLLELEGKNNLISLSDRFGSWIGFHNFNKTQYLLIVDYYINKYSVNKKNSKIIHNLAMEWSIEKGNLSGRTAFQFVKNLIINSGIKN